jgi:hypothetical protein
MSFSFPKNETVLGYSKDNRVIYFQNIISPSNTHYFIKNFYPKQSEKDLFIQNRCELVFNRKNGFKGGTPIINYRDKRVPIDVVYVKQLLKKYFEDNMWGQFQEHIPEFDKQNAFKRFIEFLSETIIEFNHVAWLKQFNY